MDNSYKINLKVPKSAIQNRNKFIKWVIIGIVLSIIMEILAILATFEWLGKIYDASEVQTATGYVASIDVNSHKVSKTGIISTTYKFELNNGSSYNCRWISITKGIKEIQKGDWVTITYVPNSRNDVRGISSEDKVYFILSDYNEYNKKFHIPVLLMFNFVLLTPIWIYVFLWYYPHEYLTVKRRHKERINKMKAKLNQR